MFDSNSEFNKLIENSQTILNDNSIKTLKKAFNFAQIALKDCVFNNGEPVLKHNLRLATYISQDIKLDDISIASALLSNILYFNPNFSYEDINSNFGNVIADICEGMYKIDKIAQFQFVEEGYLENYRIILFSLFQDVRIILIKLVDRLLKMRNLKKIETEDHLKYSKETMEVFVPFANRFGLTNIKSELEDLSFKQINRKAYNEINVKLFGSRRDREKYVKDFANPVEERLKKDNLLNSLNINFTISGRAKHIYSVYNKTFIRNKPVEELYDLVAIRVIIDTDDPIISFYVYGIIASLYPPVPETFKDYINAPKPNGYQSIHCAVMGPTQKPVEVQIRTKKMHEISEKGVAAHFLYKRGQVTAQSVLDNPNAQEWMSSVREIFENAGSESPGKLLDTIKKNMFLDEIHAFTPQNKMLTFPKGSTPLDFAFHLHSDLGYHCVGAKVNGKTMPLNYKLKSGDQVEIIVSKNNIPQKEWLDFVFTSKSKSHILKYFKNEEKKLIQTGQSIWKEKIGEGGLKMNKNIFENMLKALQIDDENIFYSKLGSGEIKISDVIEMLKYKYKYHGIVRTQKKHASNRSKNSELLEKMQFPCLICLEIDGKDRSALVNEITAALLEHDNISIEGLQFDSLEDRFRGLLKVNFEDLSTFTSIYEVLAKIENVENLRIV